MNKLIIVKKIYNKILTIGIEKEFVSISVLVCFAIWLYSDHKPKFHEFVDFLNNIGHDNFFRVIIYVHMVQFKKVRTARVGGKILLKSKYAEVCISTNATSI